MHPDPGVLSGSAVTMPACHAALCLALHRPVQAGARYAEGLLKALGVQQAILVGHSAGALTAMEVFKRYAPRSLLKDHRSCPLVSTRCHSNKSCIVLFNKALHQRVSTTAHADLLQEANIALGASVSCETYQLYYLCWKLEMRWNSSFGMTMNVSCMNATVQTAHESDAVAAGLCRNPGIVSAMVFVAPALPSSSTSTKAAAKNEKKEDSKDSFIWRASLGQQLQRLYMRALLQNENAGLNYIRKNLQKRRNEVTLGKLQVYADADQEVKQV